MGLRDLFRERTPEELQNMKECEQKIQEIEEQMQAPWYEGIAYYSFVFSLEEVDKELKKLHGKRRTEVEKYLRGEKIDIPLFAKEWVALPKQSPKEYERAIIEYAQQNNETVEKVREQAERYENFIEFVNDENFDIDNKSFTPICTTCGAVITSWYEKCPNCGEILKEDLVEEKTDNPSVEVMYCEDCGAEVETGAKFCKTCGKAIQTNVSFCSSCGTKLENGSKFCPTCGKAL